MKEIPLASTGKVTLVDDEDYEWLSQNRWRLSALGYVVRKQKIDGVIRVVAMHRAILRLSKGLEADHINGDKLDNQKSNLRVCTRSENNRNLPSRSRCGYKGVDLRPRLGWRASVRHEGRQIHLGYFPTAEEAATAYDEAAREYGGEFARLNFPREGERSA